MARIEAKNGFSYNLLYLDLNSVYQGYYYTASSTVFRVDYGGGYSDTFRGSGFTYNAIGEPTGGTVTSYLATGAGYVALTVTSVSVPATRLVKVAQTASNSDDIVLFKSFLAGKDTIIGNTARDVIAGYDGNDVLAGCGGNDAIMGGNGNDTIIGGTGQDALAGSAGYDVFRFDSVSHSTRSSPDKITDFQRGWDTIDLSRMDADPDTAGNQAFKFIGSKAFTGIDGQLRTENGYVYGDLNGDKIADFTIRVISAEILVGSCFIL